MSLDAIFNEGVFDRTDVQESLDEIAHKDDNGNYVADEGQSQTDVDELVELDATWWGGTYYSDSAFDGYLDDLINEIFLANVPDIIRYNIDREGMRNDLRDDYTIFEWNGNFYYVVY